MAKIILNKDYVATDDVKQTGKYLFDSEQDGAEPVELTVWLEKSKANEQHPDGKPWILLPKDNVTNRRYFSEDLFNATAVDGVVEVEVKTTPPRVLGATGVKQTILKWLNEEDAAMYTELVEGAVEAYKEAKNNFKKKKPEDMTVEELESYIEALKAGEKPKVATGPKSFLDMFTEEEYDLYNELLAKAAENKANAPRAPRRKLTEEEKAKRAEKRKQKEISKAEELLEALLATAK